MLSNFTSQFISFSHKKKLDANNLKAGYMVYKYNYYYTPFFSFLDLANFLWHHLDNK